MGLKADVQRLLEAHRDDLAAELLRRAGCDDPEAHAGWVLVCDGRFQAGDHAGAIAAVDQALWCRQDARTWLLRAAVLDRVDRLEEALAACEYAIRCDPYSPRPYLRRALAFERLDRTYEALWEYDRSLSLDSTSIDALCGKAGALFVLQQYPQAQAVLERALNYDPRFIPTWRGLALALFMQRLHGRAVWAIDQALAIDGNDSDSLTLKAGIVEEMGRKREARQLLKRAIALDPRNDVALAFKAHMDHQRTQRLTGALLHYGGGAVLAAGVGVSALVQEIADPNYGQPRPPRPY